MLKSLVRGLVLVVLGLAVAGFGLSSLCGGYMVLAALTGNGALLGFSLPLFLVCGLLAWGMWILFERVLDGDKSDHAPDRTAAKPPGQGMPKE